MTARRQKARLKTGLHIVRKVKRGLSTYYVYAWRGGPQIHKQTDTKPDITLELIRKADAARNEERGIDSDMFEVIISAYRESPEFLLLADSTQRDYRRWLDRISAQFGDWYLEAFEDRRVRGDIMAWRDTWIRQPRTADKAVVMMSTIIGWAIERGKMNANHAAGIKHLHKVNKADEIWEPSHWELFESVNPPAHLMDALKLASLTGLRLGDLVKVAWEHVEGNAIDINTKKRAGDALIPITPELRRVLESREWRTGPILRNSRGEPWTDSGLGSVFQKKQPKGFDRTMHDLRGTYVTFLAIKGMTNQQIADTVGWTAKRVEAVRARYVDRKRVIAALLEKLAT